MNSISWKIRELSHFQKNFLFCYFCYRCIGPGMGEMKRLHRLGRKWVKRFEMLNLSTHSPLSILGMSAAVCWHISIYPVVVVHGSCHSRHLAIIFVVNIIHPSFAVIAVFAFIGWRWCFYHLCILSSYENHKVPHENNPDENSTELHHYDMQPLNFVCTL